jgi:hypothetical protein
MHRTIIHEAGLNDVFVQLRAHGIAADQGSQQSIPALIRTKTRFDFLTSYLAKKRAFALLITREGTVKLNSFTFSLGEQIIGGVRSSPELFS